MSSTHLLTVLDKHNGDDSPQSYIHHLRFLGIHHHLRFAPFIGLAALFVSAGT